MNVPAAGSAEALAQGEERYRAGAYAEAAAILDQLAAREPENAGALRLLGLCRLRLGEPARGFELLAAARALAPNDPYARLHYGLGLHAMGRHAEAAGEFRACAPLLPADPAPHLNLAAALLAQGDAAGALDAARRARRRAPALGQTHYMLGMALLAADRLDEAADAFAKALRLMPNLADAWVNIGVIRYRRDDIDGAKAAMTRALALAPGHPAATANLAVFLRLTGQTEAAEALLDEVLARRPDAAEAGLNKAAALLQESRPAEALALLEAQPALAETSLGWHWRLQHALALLQLHRADEARTALAALQSAPAALAPLVAWRRALLALADGDIAGAQAAADEMARLLSANRSLLPEHRIMAHYDLARFWSQQRQPDRAFPHWIAGHRLLSRLQPFSRKRHRAFVDTMMSQLDRARFAAGPRASNRDPTPVFIVGMPRSGTTLAEQIIAAHAWAFGAGEREALGRVFHSLAGAEHANAAARLAALDRSALDAAAADYLDGLRALAPDAARVIDKMPGNFSYLGLVGLMLPGARIIHCVRDPRDIGLSIFTFRFYGYHPYAHDLGDLGWYIGQHDKLMAHWREVLPNPILILPLKDWVEDFVGTLRRVLEFLDLPYDAACERFYEQDTRVRTVSRAQVKQPVNANGLGRWRPYEQHLQPLIEELAAAGALPDVDAGENPAEQISRDEPEPAGSQQRLGGND